MSKNGKPMSYEQSPSRRDHLTLTSEEGKIELTEEQLDRVTGALSFAFAKVAIDY